MKIYMIRHGETQWNVEKRLQGASDTDLNEKGIALARKTGEALKQAPFSCCFTSPLKRAKRTAELILGDRPVPIYEEPRLQEISFGKWEGVEASLLPEGMLERFFHETEAYQASEGAESIQEVCKRAKHFWEEITQREDLQEKTILITAHGCIIRALLQNVYEDASIENFWHGKVPQNCSVNLVEVKQGKTLLLQEDVVYGEALQEAE